MSALSNPAEASYGELLAERIVQLVGIARGAGSVMAAHTRPPVYPLANAEGMAQVENAAGAMPTLDNQRAARLKQRTPWTTPIPPTAPPRFPTAWINGFGWGKAICRRRNEANTDLNRIFTRAIALNL